MALITGLVYNCSRPVLCYKNKTSRRNAIIRLSDYE